MNHCPVYTRIGGHGYGTVYPGPIGAILEPQLQGLKVQGELAQASSLCGACSEVCPVRIPIPQLLNRLRHEHAEGSIVPGGNKPGVQGVVWGTWAAVHASPTLYRGMTASAGRLRGLLGGPLAGLLGPWTRTRAAPAIAPRSLHALARQEGLSDE